ncbi:hypothetical protein SSX86_008068 [Deinandra increscens subsp. villosa]|uniref:AtC3H23-like CCCH zinc finger domain-containing protein n=1 Tax=Deinandra increscens subsp. villosa TaxID=3103831 RepID=A0AAP0H3R5_9ASTR
MYPHGPSCIDDPISPQRPNTIEDYACLLRNDAAVRRYLRVPDGNGSNSGGMDFDLTSEAYACDSLRMYEFRIRKCTHAQSHDWTDYPYVHPGEKARRSPERPTKVQLLWHRVLVLGVP